MAVPSLSEAQGILGTSFNIRVVGENLAIEPKLVRGQTDEQRAEAVELAKAKFETAEGVRLNVTSKTIHTLWVNEANSTGVAQQLRDENEALKARLDRMEAFMASQSTTQLDEAVEASEAAPF